MNYHVVGVVGTSALMVNPTKQKRGREKGGPLLVCG